MTAAETNITKLTNMSQHAATFSCATQSHDWRLK